MQLAKRNSITLETLNDELVSDRGRNVNSLSNVQSPVMADIEEVTLSDKEDDC